MFPKKIVTTLEDGRAFYPAEAYHQDFLVRNPSYPYIVIYDIPKVRNLAQVFPDVYRMEPVLVTPRAARPEAASGESARSARRSARRSKMPGYWQSASRECTIARW